MEEYMSQEDINRLKLSNKDAVNLYIFSILNGLDTSLIRIPKADKDILIKTKIIDRQLVDGDVKIVINLENKSLSVAMNDVESDVEKHINDYRKIFRNVRNDGIGNKSTVKKNLIKFLNENPEFNIQDVLEAAKLYINSMPQGELKYAKRADYFIYKVPAPGAPRDSTLEQVLNDLDHYKAKNESWTKMV